MDADAIVIGSGATGSWAAKQLAEAGLEVLLLEAGPSGPPAIQAALDEPLDQSPAVRAEAEKRQPIQQRHGLFARQTRHLFVDDLENPYAAPSERPFDWIRSRQEGGRTLLWGGVTPRFEERDFLPSDGNPGWPFRLAELERFYEEVETFLGVRAGVGMTPAEQHLAERVRARWPDRRWRNAVGVPHRSETSAWSPLTSQGSTLAAAARTGRLQIRTNAVVRRIETSEDGRVAEAVVYFDRITAREIGVAARVIFLCASAIESARVLLCSTSPRHPDGLANSSGQLGRNLMDHPSIGVFGRLPSEWPVPPARQRLGGPEGIWLAPLPLAAGNDDVLGGYSIYGGAQREHPAVPDLPRSFLFHASCEMLPRGNNRVTIDASRHDAFGVPIANIDCSYSPSELSLLDDARARLLEMVEAAGFQVEREDPPSTPGNWVHEVGTARMGNDPRTSVLNAYNRTWDVDNLYLTDGACFPSSGCYNPTLTMMALTVRACAEALRALR